MKILGIGIDIIEHKRINKSIKNPNFKNRVFSSNELKQLCLSKNKTNYFSKRFAAKEAFAKALGTGFRNNLSFKDIEIVHNKLGKPNYLKNKKITKLIQKNFKVKNFDCFLSISDEKHFSTAFAVIQSL
tara:strand:- start:371 stop:757 length:387 start_codon:yes stop_codon:yes gene_type:complete